MLLWAMIACLLFSVIRIIKGPSVWDRLLGMNLVSTKIILIIAAFASYSGYSYLLDFAIIYALTGFISTIFISKFLSEHKNVYDREEEPHAD